MREISGAYRRPNLRACYNNEMITVGLVKDETIRVDASHFIEFLTSRQHLRATEPKTTASLGVSYDIARAREFGPLEFRFFVC